MLWPTRCGLASLGVGGTLAPMDESPPTSEAAATERGVTRWSARLRLAGGIVLVSVAASAFAIAFRAALQAALAAAGSTSVVDAVARAPWWLAVVLPCAGALLAALVQHLGLRQGSSQGVGDVMEAVVLGKVRLSFRVTVVKSLASWFAIATGNSIGREGPLIQFGGAAGQKIASLLSMRGLRMQTMIAAGTAAGFAAAYNTPFAAALFVIEVVTGVVVLETLLPTLAAIAVATAITRAVIGPGPIYGVRAFTLHSPWELAAFAGLGALAALTSWVFVRCLARGERLLDALPRSRFARAAVGGLATGLLVALVPQVAGNGYEPLGHLLDGHVTAGFVLILCAAKVLATTSSVASGSPGGIFTPTLLIGGCTGAAYALAIRAVFGLPADSVGGYVLVGMAAACAATTHAPLLGAVMAFELSGDYGIVLPLILATSISTAASRALGAESVYATELRRRGVQWQITMDGRRLRHEATR